MSDLQKEISYCMECTTDMNRGEVEPSLDGILFELESHFSQRDLKMSMDFIKKYYRYMVLNEWLEFQKWRIGK